MANDTNRARTRGLGYDGTPWRVGFVPSIEVLPFLEWAPNHEVEVKACPGYGSVTRGLLTRRLDAGLLPWELVVSDLLLKPGQMSGWRVPAVLKTCPMELVLSRTAAKAVYPSRARKLKADPVSLVFGIEARNSFTRNQILEWQNALEIAHLAVPSFKVLPMNLMLRGLENGEIDGVVAPVPWGMQAEKEGYGKIDPNFVRGRFAQHLVLVCSRAMQEAEASLLALLPDKLRQMKHLFSDAEGLVQSFGRMNEISSSRLDQSLGFDAARKYQLHSLPDEFTPRETWFKKELGIVASRYELVIQPAMAKELMRGRLPEPPSVS